MIIILFESQSDGDLKFAFPDALLIASWRSTDRPKTQTNLSRPTKLIEQPPTIYYLMMWKHSAF